MAFHSLLRYSAVRTALLLVALSLPLPAWAAESKPAVPPLEHVSLQLKWKHQFQFAGYYAALKKGYYREAGLDVSIREAPARTAPVQEVLDGRAEFGVGSSDLILMRSQGAPVVALGAIYQHSPLILLALKKSGVDNLHQLAGKRVMIEHDDAELLAYFQYEDVPIGKLLQVPHAFDTTPLQRGEVAATSGYSTDEPFQLREAGLDYLTFNPRAGGIDFYGDTLFTTEAQLRQHPKRVRAFLDASLRGWQYAMDHPDEMISLILSEYSTRHSRAHLKFEAEQTRRLIMPDVVELGYMNPGRWQRIIETYVQLGMAPRVIPVKGFLYERNPKPNLTWLYLSLVSVVGVLGMVSLVAARFYQLNRVIHREVKERRRAEAHLRALEQRHRILAENAPFPIIITRLEDGVIRYVNPAAAQALELPPEAIVGERTESFYANPQDRQVIRNHLLEHGTVRDFEVRLKRANEAEFWAALSATCILFEEERAAFVALMDISERKDLETRLKRLAMTDDLTGLYNRRSFVREGDDELAVARSKHQPAALLMLDVDEFKLLNDTHGHAAGDRALRRLAAMFHRHMRERDIAGRLGGEEFGVLLADTDLGGAVAWAETLRAEIQEEPLAGGNGEVRMTASVGVAVLDPEVKDLDDLLNRADTALYAAKSKGRNRVEPYSGSSKPTR